MTLQISAVQWSSLDHIADVRPIDDTDASCLMEIRAVLEKHRCLERFGVALLHNHFDLAEDEILLETTDVNTREQFLRPVKQSWMDENGVTAQTTVVTFDEKGYHRRCGCNPRTSGHHHL
ncbi:hypothetical protein GCM10011505_03190 [Tistrella bauzanensis]|uniref:Uncharacterized protein n=1 Tax=Tistrella bauzanensis TaxID=657419 RepID=A0ABQ1I7U0_9PROT|nr:hypothetical protein [Tistrella bauzanensis]GGB25340.1 hypothetical protein GCM10011505_03190 [Tistrella bauzanensis]